MLLHRATTLKFTVTCCRRTLTEGQQPPTVRTSEKRQVARKEPLKRYYLKNKDNLKTKITNKKQPPDNKQITEYQTTYHRVKETGPLEQTPRKRKNDGEKSEQSQEEGRQERIPGEHFEGEVGTEHKYPEKGRKEYFRSYYHKTKPRLQELWAKNPEKLQKYREENKQKLKKYRQRYPEKAIAYRLRNSQKIIAYRKQKRGIFFL
jgi:hypothetical protein